ncbi:MAG: Gfo/Idh/MocA family oxidoreductase [Planctomycetaceae bacterium]|jgi:predicted dehydrogenase|nr:Gfo/Idh/MocA family oxidoreductase [Planctomycetaceae bacterium]
MKQISRRHFLQGTSLTAFGFWAAAGLTPVVRAASPNERISVAGIGIGGKGGGDIANAARWGDIVAVCDIDRGRLAQSAKRYEGAKAYTDFRKLFDEMEKSIDAVTVSTSDHVHTAASLMAMRRGKHVYAQKPLTRTIYESRLMGKTALERKVCTQMGNQGSAGDGLRKTAAQLQAGVLGNVTEIHIWTNRPIWAQGIDRKKQSDFSQEEIEKGLQNVDWDSWIGPAPTREFLPGVYHSFNWRGWWDFGTGALGDICCHSLNMAFVGLDLRNPASVIAKTTGHNHDSFPSRSVVTFQFPALGKRGAVKFVWYDGGWKPSDEMLGDHGFSTNDDNGTLIIGEKGYIRGSQIVGVEPIKDIDVRLAPKTDDNNEDASHSLEWGTAIKENKPENCWSNFTTTSGPLTETVLAGNLAVWNADKPNEEGDLIEWDAVNMKITNNVKTSGLDELIKPVYRKGYELD